MRAVLEPADLQRYDELTDPNGRMRAHWRPLIDRLRADESPDAVRRALELTRRLIVENGVTYNVYADPQGADRPWALDPLPFVLPAAEWQAIETGRRAARAPARCAARGPVRPAAAARRRAHARRSCRSAILTTSGRATACGPPTARWLHVYAADLARAPDGRWWVLADRTQAPSGAGYALENREILEQVHPEADSRHGRAPRARLLRRSARAHAERSHRWAPARIAARRDPHARSVQRNLLRARVSRAPARHAAGRRPRSHGARRHGLSEDARRPAARARDPAPARRRLLRSARAARRLRARRARAC